MTPAGLAGPGGSAPPGGSADVRKEFRAGLVCPTAGLAPGVTQANLIALPRDWAWDMLLYGQRNPQPCPVLDVSDPGVASTVLAPGADLRTDLPCYRVYRNGALLGTTTGTSALHQYATWGTYAVAAYDAAGNVSAISAGVTVR